MMNDEFVLSWYLKFMNGSDGPFMKYVYYLK